MTAIYIPAPNPNPPSAKVRSLLLQASMLEGHIENSRIAIRQGLTSYIRDLRRDQAELDRVMERAIALDC